MITNPFLPLHFPRSFSNTNSFELVKVKMWYVDRLESRNDNERIWPTSNFSLEVEI